MVWNSRTSKTQTLRHTTSKVWLRQWFLKGSEDKTFYWATRREEIHVQTPTPPIFQAALFSRKFANRSLNNIFLSLRSIYNEFPHPSPQLTPSQQCESENFSMSTSKQFSTQFTVSSMLPELKSSWGACILRGPHFSKESANMPLWLLQPGGNNYWDPFWLL